MMRESWTISTLQLMRKIGSLIET